VYREGLDREALKCATANTGRGAVSLRSSRGLYYPEQRPSLQPDGWGLLSRSLGGPAATASPRSGKVVVHRVHPLLLRGDLAGTLTPVLQKIEARLSWRRRINCPAGTDRKDRARPARAQGNRSTSARRRRVARGAITAPAGSPPDAAGTGVDCRPSRTGHHGARQTSAHRHPPGPGPRRTHGGRAGTPVAATRRPVSRPATALLLWKLSGRRAFTRALARNRGALRGGPDRRGQPVSTLHVVISVGEAIEATPARERGADSDPLALALRRQLEIMLAQSKPAGAPPAHRKHSMIAIIAAIPWGRHRSSRRRRRRGARPLVLDPVADRSQSAPKDGIGDVVHDLTARWHHYLSTHARAANAALITSSIFIDLISLTLIARRSSAPRSGRSWPS